MKSLHTLKSLSVPLRVTALSPAQDCFSLEETKTAERCSFYTKIPISWTGWKRLGKWHNKQTHANYRISDLSSFVWKSSLTPLSRHPVTIPVVITHSAGLGYSCSLNGVVWTALCWVMVSCLRSSSCCVPLQLEAGCALDGYQLEQAPLSCRLLLAPLLAVHAWQANVHLPMYIYNHCSIASTAIRELHFQTFRIICFDMEHVSYLYSSQIWFHTEQSEKEKKKRHTSINFLSMKWLFLCIWNIFQLQAWFSN